MAHEITNTDGAVYHRNRAWHGLGVVVEDAPTPQEALTIAGIDWGLGQHKLYFKDEEGVEHELDSHVLNYRKDNGDGLGVVTSGYTPVSNKDMADFCESLIEDGGVTCESAGSLFAGKRIWMLLKGEKFSVAKGDGIFPYILVSNGHDGGASFRVTPTTVRVVCANTLHAVIPRKETGELMGSAIRINHTVNVMERVVAAREALKEYANRMDQSKKLFNELAQKEVTASKMQQFFWELYNEDFGDVPTNPQNKWEERRKQKAQSAYGSFTRRFDDEKELAGSSLWCMFNAYSGIVQHDVKARGKDDANRVERRIDANLFGLNQDRTRKALKKAFQMAQ